MEIVRETREILEKKIIPFWLKLEDQENGGFYGYVDDKTLEIDKKSDKGSIVTSRILYFMSEAALFYKDKDSALYAELKKGAEHAYRFLLEHLVDRHSGGVIWSVTYDGKPKDTTKHTYAMAFAIYALSSFYGLEKREEVMSLLSSLYSTIEEICWDGEGYMESFHGDWSIKDNVELSENGVLAERTMNTLLHVIEAYANLYHYTGAEYVGIKLSLLLNIYKEKIFDEKEGRLKVFMDSSYRSIIDLWSFGHDIEASWLIDWAAEVLGDEAIKEEIFSIDETLSRRVYEEGRGEKWLKSERENGVDNLTATWWGQCEAVEGFLNHWKKTGEEKYLKAAETVFSSIMEDFIDKREGGEMHSEILPDGKVGERAQVELWKGPYHDGRMCIEILRCYGE